MQAPHGAAHLDQVKRHNAMRCLHCRTVHRPGHEAFFWAVSASSGAFIRAEDGTVVRTDNGTVVRMDDGTVVRTDDGTVIRTNND